MATDTDAEIGVTFKEFLERVAPGTIKKITDVEAIPQNAGFHLLLPRSIACRHAPRPSGHLGGRSSTEGLESVSRPRERFHIVGALGSARIQSFGYTTVNYLEPENCQRAAVEIATHLDEEEAV
jgi:hypothetical protein